MACCNCFVSSSTIYPDGPILAPLDTAMSCQSRGAREKSHAGVSSHYRHIQPGFTATGLKKQLSAVPRRHLRR